MTSAAKRRSDRLSQAKHRSGKQSYVTQLENALLLLAWEAGELTEGQAAAALGVDRLTARELRDGAIARGVALHQALRPAKPATAPTPEAPKAPIIDLMAALKASLASAAPKPDDRPAAAKVEG